MGIEKKIANQRTNIRHPIEVPIRLTDKNGAEQKAVSGNVSDCGLYLTITVAERPDIDSIVQVQVTTPMGDGSAAPINRAQVMRHDENGVGLKFVFDDDK
jgi:PilZ domain